MEENNLAGGPNLSVTEPGTDLAEPLAESADEEEIAVNHANSWRR